MCGRHTSWADTPSPRAETPLGRHTPGQTPPKMATAADGTHPTGMHSCYLFCYCLPTEWQRQCFQSCLSALMGERDPCTGPSPSSCPLQDLGPICTGLSPSSPDIFKLAPLGPHSTAHNLLPGQNSIETQIPKTQKTASVQLPTSLTAVLCFLNELIS